MGKSTHRSRSRLEPNFEMMSANGHHRASHVMSYRDILVLGRPMSNSGSHIQILSSIQNTID